MHQVNVSGSRAATPPSVTAVVAGVALSLFALMGRGDRSNDQEPTATGITLPDKDLQKPASLSPQPLQPPLQIKEIKSPTSPATQKNYSLSLDKYRLPALNQRSLNSAINTSNILR